MPKDELPILLLRFTPTEDEVPADLSFLAVDASQAESVYPPGTWLEQRKETSEWFSPSSSTERIEAKLVDVNTHFGRASTLKPVKKEKEAEPKAPTGKPA